ncbi:Zn-ribbon domain-containing OB-fold protein [Oceanobacillus saliphilus]|uniref:Zn-ribbon domain-containing OB-fold protein n=1 Tax=Oceanobacillus saliphilus TaxID=2925834 RepID=UPI00201D6E6C|nr:Zn-ribbon domain-containing OB-fold protein [Oceanobacillus saliphilus]
MVNVSRISRPLPHIEENKLYGPYFKGLQENKLMVQNCTECGHVQWPPRDFCYKCQGNSLDWKEVQQSGKVFTYSIMYRAFDPWFKDKLPYAVVAVELEDGVRMLGSYFADDVESIEVDMPMKASFNHENKDVSVLTWVKDNTK